MFGEIDKLKVDGPTEQEVANVQAAMRRRWEVASKENGFWLSQLVSAYRDGRDPREVLAYEESLETLNPEAIQTAAGEYFNVENYVKVSLFPEQ